MQHRTEISQNILSVDVDLRVPLVVAVETVALPRAGCLSCARRSGGFFSTAWINPGETP